MIYTGNEELVEVNKNKNLKLEYKINENKARVIYKEQYIRILLIKDKKESNKELENLNI